MSICIHLLLLILLFPMDFIQASGTKDLASDLENISPSTDSSLQAQNPGSIKPKEKEKPKPKEVPLKSFKNIILEDASSARPLSAAEKKSIEQEKSLSTKRKVIKSAFKITIQDERLKNKGPLNEVFNKETIEDLFKNEIFMADINDRLEKNNKKLYSQAQGFFKKIDPEKGQVEIFIYSTQDKEFTNIKELIIDNLKHCRVLNNSEITVLKNNNKIYDRKYISKACQIDIKDNLLKTTEENEIEKLFDIYFKQEIADQLNKLNKSSLSSLNLDKHMSVYLELIKTQGNLKITLAETKKEKEQALKKFLQDNLNDGIWILDREDSSAEEKFKFKYYNLYSVFWYGHNDLRTTLKKAQIQKNGEFWNSFDLIDEIIKENEDLRRGFIKLFNQIRRGKKYGIKQDIPLDDKTTIIRTEDNDGLYIYIFTQTDSPKEAIQSNILYRIDIKTNNEGGVYGELNDDIKGFEKGRSLKQGLKINSIIEDRFGEEGNSSLISYNNSEAMNKFLDDADFKRKVITKINDYRKDTDQNNYKELNKILKSPFSTTNLENIKIKAQNFNGDEFDLVVYELYPPGESDPTNPNASESAADAG